MLALKLDIMIVLERPMNIVELASQISRPGVTVGAVARALTELVTDGLLTSYDDASTIGRMYRHASERSMAELRSKLPPCRDPVREAHEDEDLQQKLPRKRRKLADPDNQS